MARRNRRGLPVHGWLVLDKPLGMSSSRAVAAVRHLLNAAKAGHGGTLDPLATGVLPIALGEATKTAPYAIVGKKHYRFAPRPSAARSGSASCPPSHRRQSRSATASRCA